MFPKHNIASLFIFLMILSASPAYAQGLKWEHKLIQKKLTPEQTEFQTAFKFTNTSDKAIHITNIKSDCLCTEATAKDSTIPAGQSSQMNVHFKTNNLTGIKRSSLIVRTDAPGNPEYPLFLEIHIPKIITIRPKLLYWMQNEPATTKTIEITLHIPGSQLKLLPPPDPTPFTVQLNKTKDPKKLQLSVTPQNTSSKNSVQIQLQTTHPKRTFPIFIQIK